MAGAADNVHMAQAEGLRGIAYRGYASGFEIAGWIIGDALDAGTDFPLPRKALARRAHLAFHAVECLVLRVAQIHRKSHLSRNDVARIGLDLQESHRAAAVGLVAVGERIDFGNHFRGGEQCVLPQPHRRGAGMRVLPGDDDVVPAQAQRAEHDADHLARILQDGSLFDMRLEVGADGPATDFFRTSVADLLERLADRHPFQVGALQGRFERESTHEHARSHHHRRETRAFLIGPHRHFDRRFSADLVIVQGANHLEPGHHSIVAVEFSARRLGVDVAAGNDGRQRVIATRPSREDVADAIDRDVAACLLAPANEQVARFAVQPG